MLLLCTLTTSTNSQCTYYANGVVLCSSLTPPHFTLLFVLLHTEAIGWHLPIFFPPLTDQTREDLVKYWHGVSCPSLGCSTSTLSHTFFSGKHFCILGFLALHFWSSGTGSFISPAVVSQFSLFISSAKRCASLPFYYFSLVLFSFFVVCYDYNWVILIVFCPLGSLLSSAAAAAAVVVVVVLVSGRLLPSTTAATAVQPSALLFGSWFGSKSSSSSSSSTGIRQLAQTKRQTHLSAITWARTHIQETVWWNQRRAAAAAATKTTIGKFIIWPLSLSLSLSLSLAGAIYAIWPSSIEGRCCCCGSVYSISFSPHRSNHHHHHQLSVANYCYVNWPKEAATAALEHRESEQEKELGHLSLATSAAAATLNCIVCDCSVCSSRVRG